MGRPGRGPSQGLRLRVDEHGVVGPRLAVQPALDGRAGRGLDDDPEHLAARALVEAGPVLGVLEGLPALLPELVDPLQSLEAGEDRGVRELLRRFGL